MPQTRSDNTADPKGESRTWNLALGFQEIFTAVVRIRTHRQNVTNIEVFRSQIKRALQLAEEDARTRGCSADDIAQSVFAVVALLDETALGSRNSAFSDWPRSPLQAELYGHQLAGEVFYRELEKILKRPDSGQTADLLEVYELCLLLGFKGKFAAGGDFRSVFFAVQEKVKRLRRPLTQLSPHSKIPPNKSLGVKSDPWVRVALWAAATSMLAAVLLYIVFKIVLSGQESRLLGLA